MGPGGPMGPGVPMYGPMRGPPPGPGGPMPPISSMGPGGPGPRPPWHPGGPGPMSPYHHHSPGYVGPPPGPGPGTPIMPSPGGPPSEGDPLYMMKNVPMSGESGPGSSGGEGGPPNGAPDLDNMKSSPTTAPTTPREGDHNIEFNMPNFPQGENVRYITITQTSHNHSLSNHHPNHHVGLTMKAPT